MNKQEGWHVTDEAGAQLIFYKKGSTCYIRNREDFKDHLFSKCLSAFEYFEGIQFWEDNKKENYNA